MPFFECNRKRAFFIHVPKTGGTTITDWIRSCGVLHFHADDRADMAVSPQHMHAELLKRCFDLSAFDVVFTVVRNPYSRIVSEYTYRKYVRRKKMPSFSTWLRRSLNRYRRDQYVHDNHIRPQAAFLTPEADIFRLEDGMGAVESYLADKFTLDEPPQLGRSNTSRREAVVCTEHDIERIGRFYADDFEKFNYSLAPPPGLFKIRRSFRLPSRHGVRFTS